MNLKHGQRVTCEIQGVKIADARISFSNGDFYVCQNLGGTPVSKRGYLEHFGFKHSVCIGDGSKLNLYSAVKNLRPAPKTWETLVEGDKIRDDYVERMILGVCGKVFLLSDSRHSYETGYTVEEMRRKGWSIVQDPAEPEEEPPIEMTLEEVAKLRGVPVERIKIVEKKA